MLNRLVLYYLLVCCVACWPGATSAEFLPALPRQAAKASQDSAKPTLSPAEQIARLQRSVDSDEAALKKLTADLNNPESEFAQAESAFRQLDTQRATLMKEIQSLNDRGETEQASERAKRLEEIETEWQLARKRFDLAIDERRILQEKIETLEKKIAQDRAAIERIKGDRPVKDESSDAAQREADSASPPQAAAPAAEQAAKPDAAAESRIPALPGLPIPMNGLTSPAKTDSPSEAAPAGTAAAPSKELVQARAEADEKREAAARAEQELQSIESRIELLRKSIQGEQELLDTTRKKVDAAVESRQTLTSELQKKYAEGADAESIAELTRKLGEEEQRFREAHAKARKIADRRDSLRAELSDLQVQQNEALQDAERKQQESQAAQKKVAWYENPFAPQNLTRWAFTHGPRIAAILVMVTVLLWLARVIDRRFVRFVTRPGARERIGDANRAQTLVGVLHNAISVVIVVVGIVMLLDEIGINVGVVMGGAAVVGLAVAFGAQNLIRDYFYGFIILLENQYAVNDVVQIGETKGKVERITLRITVLRGLDGTVHFLPNGEITKVSNMTHGWSRALLDVPVAYKEDVDRVMDILVQIGQELRADPDFSLLVLDDPEMLGVDQFGDSAVVIRFYIKTRPLAQWPVKREMLRRIKKRFDELEIEIPFPHRTVYHRYDGVRGDEIVEREVTS